MFYVHINVDIHILKLLLFCNTERMDVLIFVKNVRRSSFANCDTARTTLPCSFVEFFLNDNIVNTFDKNVFLYNVIQ